MKKTKGNVIYERESEFWIVVVLQILAIFTIPFAIHNIYHHIKKIKNEKNINTNPK